MDIDTFNSLSSEHAQAILSHCAAMPSWVAAVEAGRPYTSADRLYQCALAESQRWQLQEEKGQEGQWQEVAAALAKHPRIGERHPGIGERRASSSLSAKEQAFSQQEQGNLQLDASLEQQLYQGNVAYEEKFGHIFLIRAAGRSASEILTELLRRLDNSVASEQKEVAQQLAAIALLRLQQEVSA